MAQRWIVTAVLSGLLLLVSIPLVSAQDKPRYGGELVFVMTGTRNPARCGARVACGINASGDGDDGEMHRVAG